MLAAINEKNLTRKKQSQINLINSMTLNNPLTGLDSKNYSLPNKKGITMTP